MSFRAILASDQRVPQTSSGRLLTIDEIESPVLLRARACWNELRGSRRFPARSDLTPRVLGALLPHVLLLKVIDDGANYEFRIVGDIHVQAYGGNFQNKRLSEIALTYPSFAAGRRILCEGVRMGRDPFGYRGWIGRDMPDTRFVYHESAYFPLGATDEAVDHVLTVAVYVPRAGGVYD